MRLTHLPAVLRLAFSSCSVLLLQLGCAHEPDAAPPRERPAASASAARAKATAAPVVKALFKQPPVNGAAPAPAASAAATVDAKAYPWLSDRTLAAQSIAGPLSARFAPPAGLTRVAAAEGSFAQWLRGLPLRPAGPVVDYKGRVVLGENDPRFAAVIALDEGTADLQQCADSVIRLHAEWQWAQGSRAMDYRAASGAAMPFARWLAGDRPAAEGNVLRWKASARAGDRDDHGAFRKYLDAVFTWANTGALARDAGKSSLETLRPGDFFVLAGSPGHAVLVLDVAAGAQGERALLLGQGYMPAQSFHVLRPSADAVWFTLDAAAGGLQTPFWPAPFPWSSLRRLD